MTTKKKIKEKTDRNFYLFTYDLGKAADSFHNVMLSACIEGLWKEGFRDFNYDHLPEFYRKEKQIPLHVGGRKWDIVVRIDEHHYGVIEIKILREIEIKEEEKEEAWQK